jgi:hypothetical protein
MPKMMIAIGVGKPKDDDEEMSEYELGARDMRDKACALAEMYESGSRPSKKLSKLIDALPLDEREEDDGEAPESKPSGSGEEDEEDGY